MLPISGLIYRNVIIYKLVMHLLYGRDYDRKYQAVADLIPPDSTVVDLCSGDCVLAGKLQRKGCTYLGLELNPCFVHRARTSRINAQVSDVRTDPIPQADVVCMQSSLYHFIPEDHSLVQRMIESARRLVVISEPVQNFTQGNRSRLSRLAISLSEVDGQAFSRRHSLETLGRTMDRVMPRGALVARVGREAIFVIQKEPHAGNVSSP